LAATLLTGLVACSDDKEEPKKDTDTAVTDADVTVSQDVSADSFAVLPKPTTPVVTLKSGKGTLEINLDRQDLVVRHDGAWRTRVELPRLRMGRVGRFDIDVNYSPTEYTDSNDPKKVEFPDKFEWLKVGKATFTEHNSKPLAPRPDSVPVPACETTEGYSLQLPTTAPDGKAGAPLRLRIYALACKGADGKPIDGIFQAHLDLAEAADRTSARLEHQAKSVIDMPVWLDIPVTTGGKERFYGLGEYFDAPEHRGRIRPMVIRAQLDLESGYNEAHVPVPLVIGTGGWGLFVESRRPAVFDCGAQDPDRVHARFHDLDLRFFLFAADRPTDIVGRYTRVSGAPTMPAPWAFGALIWRNENKSQAEVLDDMTQIRKNDLAISGMWIDRPYDTHVNNFDFDPKRFEDADKMIKTVQDMGMRVALWSTPYVEEGGKYRKEFLDKGWMVKTPVIVKQFLKWGGPVDLTNPAVKTFWKGLCNGLRKRGIEGWKLDFAEDTHVGLFGVRTHYSFHNGQDERTMHHAYALYYHAPYFETLPGPDAGSVLEGGMILARAGTYGGQTLASIIWPGDLDATLGEHGDCDDDTCHVAGMPGAVVALQSLAASGYPLFGSDTGGYRHKRASKVTFMRWMSHTAMTPIMQLGGSKQHNPWDFAEYPKSQFDSEVLKAAVYWTRLHTRLFPYLYGFALAARDHKPGPVRPFGMVHADLRHHGDVAKDFKLAADTQYWLGDAFLVAPIQTDDSRRHVVLPPVTLFDWWTGKQANATTLAGAATPTSFELKMPLDRMPLYLRGGKIVPMLRESIDTIAPAKDKLVDSYANDPGVLVALVAPGPASERVVFDETHLGFDVKGSAINLAVTPGKTFKKGIQWQLLTPGKVKAVAVGGVPAAKVSSSKAKTCVGCWWRSGNFVHVRLPPGKQTAVVLYDKPPI